MCSKKTPLLLLPCSNNPDELILILHDRFGISMKADRCLAARILNSRLTGVELTLLR